MIDTTARATAATPESAPRYRALRRRTADGLVATYAFLPANSVAPNSPGAAPSCLAIAPKRRLVTWYLSKTLEACASIVRSATAVLTTFSAEIAALGQ